MPTTYCLSDFAKRLSATPREQWKALVESMPETCDRCGTTCREVCADYARMQWRMAQRRRK